MWLGRLLGTVLGAVFGGFFGAVLGFFAGMVVDRATASRRFRVAGFSSPGMAKQAMFETLFSLMGHLAKADGRVSEEEIHLAEEMIRNHRFDRARREEAVRYFRKGVAADFAAPEAMREFARHCAGRPFLRQNLLAMLISQALVDGELHPNERRILSEVARACSISPQRFEMMLAMMQAQFGFRAQGVANSGADRQLSEAFAALGVSAQATDQQIKRAYRKLMSDNHPDKLIARGMPEEMVKLGTEKTQQIKAAYDLIMRSRAA